MVSILNIPSSARGKSEVITKAASVDATEIAKSIIEIKESLSNSSGHLKEYATAVSSSRAYAGEKYADELRKLLNIDSTLFTRFTDKVREIDALRAASSFGKGVIEAEVELESLSNSSLPAYFAWKQLYRLIAVEKRSEAELSKVTDLLSNLESGVNKSIIAGDKSAEDMLNKSASSFSLSTQQFFIDSLYQEMKEGKEELDKFNAKGAEVRNLKDLAHEINQYTHKLQKSVNRNILIRAGFKVGQRLGADSIDEQYRTISRLVNDVDFDKISNELSKAEANLVFINEADKAYDQMSRKKDVGAGADFLKNLTSSDLKKAGFSGVFEKAINDAEKARIAAEKAMENALNAKQPNKSKPIDYKIWMLDQGNWWLKAKNLNSIAAEGFDQNELNTLQSAYSQGTIAQEEACVRMYVLLNTFFLNNSGIVYAGNKKDELLQRTKDLPTLSDHGEQIKAINALVAEEQVIYAKQSKKELKRILTSRDSEALLTFLLDFSDHDNFTSTEWDKRRDAMNDMFKQLTNRVKLPDGMQMPPPPSS